MSWWRCGWRGERRDRRLGRGGAVRALRRRAARPGHRRAERRRRAAPAPGARCGGDRPARPRGAPGGRPLAEPRRDALPVNFTLSGGPPEEVAERAREGLRAGYACFKVKVGLPGDVERVAAVREAVGLGLRCGGRQRARGRSTTRWRASANWSSTTSSSWSSRAAPSTSCARCADACPRRSRRTSRSAPARGAPGRGDRGLRCGQREAGQRRRLQARARRCGWRGRRARRVPVEHARRALGHRRRAAAGSRGGPAAGLRPRRSSCSTRRWRARCRRRSTGHCGCRRGRGWAWTRAPWPRIAVDEPCPGRFALPQLTQSRSWPRISPVG